MTVNNNRYNTIFRKRGILLSLLCIAVAVCLIFCGCERHFTPPAGTGANSGADPVPGAQDPEQPGGDPGQQGGDPSPYGTEAVPDALTGGDVTLPVDPSQGWTGVTSDFSIAAENGTFEQSGNVYVIKSAGTYTLSGKLPEGQIRVEAPEDATVTLIFSGISVSCTTDSPVFAKTADKLKINLAAGTVSELVDGRPLKKSEEDTTGSAALYAECDMNISGTGSLIVKAGYNNGIHTKDDLKISDATIKVTCPDNALKGNDSLKISSGNLTLISTSGDGIKTSNSDVSSKGNQRGTVEITGGAIAIYSGCDGIDAAYDVSISGSPSITINTNSYSEYTDASLLSTKQTSTGGNTGGRPGGPGGGNPFGGFMPGGGGSNMSNRAAESAKGIKADNEIRISGGSIVMNCRDDGVHANSDNALENGKTPLGNITISGGSVTVNVTDDGIHADGTLLVTGGYINVENSYEGLEAHYVTIENGEVHVYATDDGINAQSSGQRTSNGLITVSGGRVFVEVEGRDVDGFDANGSYKQTGGFVVVSNPAANSQGTATAVDVDSSVTVTGGTIIALGTVPGGGGGGGRMGFGGMGSSLVPSGAVKFTETFAAGEHSFTYGQISEKFTLRNRVTAGWIWSDGITNGNYTLK